MLDLLGKKEGHFHVSKDTSSFPSSVRRGSSSLLRIWLPRPTPGWDEFPPVLLCLSLLVRVL